MAIAPAGADFFSSTVIAAPLQLAEKQDCRLRAPDGQAPTICKEILFCEYNFSTENNEFEAFLFKKNTSENKLDIIELYLNKYPNSNYNDKAIVIRDSLELNKIITLNDEFALNEFYVIVTLSFCLNFL